MDSTKWYSDAIDTSNYSASQPSDKELLSLPHDPEGNRQANDLLNISKSMMSDVLRSRVLGDIWHLMDQFPIPTAHALHAPFARALSDAFFLFDTEDRANVTTVLKQKGRSWEEALRYNSDWVLRRVKRIVPGPEELVPRVAKVIYSYGPLLDPKSSQPLFNRRAWEVAANVLENLRRGYYSDPPNIPFYYPCGKDKYDLLKYRCVRGTNTIEGGIHQNIIRWFGAFNASPDFAVELLRDYTLYHNLRVCCPTVQHGTYDSQVGRLNRTGVPYRGSYDIWVQNNISNLLDNLATFFTTQPSYFGPGGWVNGNKYQCSKEIFGVLPLPHSQRDRLGMHSFNHGYAKGINIRHRYLAMVQNTLVAVLPVHTKAERALFRGLVSEPEGLFKNSKPPSWETVAGRWSEHVDGREIFYKVSIIPVLRAISLTFFKLPEHLKAYWKRWEERNAEETAVKINQATYDEVAKLLQVPTSAIPKIPTAEARSVTQQV